MDAPETSVASRGLLLPGEQGRARARGRAIEFESPPAPLVPAEAGPSTWPRFSVPGFPLPKMWSNDSPLSSPRTRGRSIPGTKIFCDPESNTDGSVSTGPALGHAHIFGIGHRHVV